MLHFFYEMIIAYRLFHRLFSNKTGELTGKNAVFNTVRTFPVPMYQELFLALLIASRGCHVTLLFDDGILPHWDTYQLHDDTRALTPYRDNILKKLGTILKKWVILAAFSHPNIRVFNYSQILAKVPLDNNKNEADRNHAESSVRRYFESGFMDLTSPDHQQYFEQSLLNCRISKAVGRFVVEYLKPNLFITSHGIYSTWGPCFDYCRNHGIESLIYGAHAYQARHILITDVITQVLCNDSDWIQNASKRIFDEEKRRSIVEYFNSRLNHRACDTKIYYGSIDRFVDRQIERNKDAYNFAMFPNIVWDGDVYERDLFFNGIIDWMIKTIDTFRGSPHKLIIRFHPAEANLWKDSRSLESCLLEKIPDLHTISNIVLIRPTEKIDTYDFVKKNIDVGIVYDGILAMELTYLGIPVISPAKNRFTGNNFVFEPKNIDEYNSWLAAPQAILRDFLQNEDDFRERLLPYAHWFIFEAGYLLPVFAPDRLMEFDFNSLTIEDLDCEINPGLKRTYQKFCRHIQ